MNNFEKIKVGSMVKVKSYVGLMDLVKRGGLYGIICKIETYWCGPLGSATEARYFIHLQNNRRCWLRHDEFEVLA
jgi:hypothetical protein